MTGSILGSEMIRASAGSGKTYRLVNRYIRLLLMGQAPERIIALTFTRKAAGEFFEGILKRLAESVGMKLNGRNYPGTSSCRN